MKAADLFLPSDRHFIGKFRITGIFQTGRRRAIRDNTEPGDELTLRREYDNKYDEFAVAVYDRYGNRIGYIERRVNEEIAFCIDSGHECVAIISDTDKTGATVGILADVFCVCDVVSMQKLKASFDGYLRDKIFREEEKQTRGI